MHGNVFKTTIDNPALKKVNQYTCILLTIYVIIFMHYMLDSQAIRVIVKICKSRASAAYHEMLYVQYFGQDINLNQGWKRQRWASLIFV